MPLNSTQTTSHAPWGRELPLVGRRQDLATLRLALDDAVEGRGRTVFLAGDSGVGKTRIVAALAKDAAARDMFVATGQAFPIETGFPFGAVTDALVPALRRLESGTLSVLARGADADLSLLLPGLLPTRAEREARAGDPDIRTRLFWNLAQFLRRLAARHPLLLAIENVQWADTMLTRGAQWRRSPWVARSPRISGEAQ